MSKKDLKKLESVRKSLQKEIERLDKHEERGQELKNPHPIIKGYLEGLRDRRRDAGESLKQIEAAIAEMDGEKKKS